MGYVCEIIFTAGFATLSSPPPNGIPQRRTHTPCQWLFAFVKGQTLVFYMGLKGLPYICQQLIAHGMDATMPVALIEKGTTQDQRVLVSDLTGLPHMIEAE